MSNIESSSIAPASSGSPTVAVDAPRTNAVPRPSLKTRSRVKHWIDSGMYPGGEIACGQALTEAQFRARATNDPSEVTCDECCDALQRQGKEGRRSRGCTAAAGIP